jgi:hypothetical protein
MSRYDGKHERALQAASREDRARIANIREYGSTIAMHHAEIQANKSGRHFVRPIEKKKSS